MNKEQREDKKIVFTVKSTPENFKNERDGSKSNTVRLMQDWDYGKIRLLVESTHIQIVSTLDCASFTQKISNKTVYNGIAIISWVHEE